MIYLINSTLGKIKTTFFRCHRSMNRIATTLGMRWGSLMRSSIYSPHLACHPCIPSILSLGGLAARRTSSSAHRLSTSYKCAQWVPASAPSIEAPRVENVMAAWPRHAAMQPYISGRAAVASRSRLAAFIADRRGSRTFVLKTLQIKTICLTPACNIPPEHFPGRRCYIEKKIA